MAIADAGMPGATQYGKPWCPYMRVSETASTIETFGQADRQHEMEVGKLILEHQPGLWKFARYLTRNNDRANDLVQDAIVRALVNAEKFTLGTNFRAWICTIARNLFYSEQRGMGEKYTSIHEMSHQPSIPSTQEQSLYFCDFQRAFQQLSVSRRKALMLVCVDGLSYDAAALSENCAVGTVKSRVSRGRGELKLLLSDGPIVLPRRAMGPCREDMALAFLTAARSVESKVKLSITAPRQTTSNSQTAHTLARWDDDGGALMKRPPLSDSPVAEGHMVEDLAE